MFRMCSSVQRPPSPPLFPYTTLFRSLLDITVVNVALPDIQKELNTDLTGLQWVVDAYTLMLAALTLTMGTLADRFGRRRSEEHTSELQSLRHLVCRLLLETKKERHRV